MERHCDRARPQSRSMSSEWRHLKPATMAAAALFCAATAMLLASGAAAADFGLIGSPGREWPRASLQPAPTIQRLKRQSGGGGGGGGGGALNGTRAPTKRPKSRIRGRDRKLLAGCLAAHNKFRRQHGVPDLQWDEKIAEFAQKRSRHIADSDGAEFGHPPDLPFGENLFWHSSAATACELMVAGWYDEINLYDFQAPVFAPATGHFTQLVWRASARLGCAFATSAGPRAGLYLTCNYDPPGNFIGEFPENVPRPAATINALANASTIPSTSRGTSPSATSTSTAATATATITTQRPTTQLSSTGSPTNNTATPTAPAKPKKKTKAKGKKNKSKDKKDKPRESKNKNKDKNKNKKKKAKGKRKPDKKADGGTAPPGASNSTRPGAN